MLGQKVILSLENNTKLKKNKTKARNNNCSLRSDTGI